MTAKHPLQTTNRNQHGGRTIRIRFSPLLIRGNSIMLLQLLYYSICLVTGFQRIIPQFIPQMQRYNNHDRIFVRYATTSKSKGFGSSSGSGDGSMSKKTTKNKNRLIDSLEDKPKNINSDDGNVAKPYVKAEQDVLLDELAYKSSRMVIGRVVAEFVTNHQLHDPFWELIPTLISSKFPTVKDDQLQRIAAFLRHTLSNQVIFNKSGSTKGIRPVDWIDNDNNNLYRPYDELHAYMPGLGPTQKFYDPSTIQLCKRLQDKYDIILQEYEALMNDKNIQNKFQSVTDMNYDSGWQTLILFYNGQRIPNFPYHKCPITTKIMESVPLAGRIAGFNRQQPMSGIPLHTDGNNMWLTCQMGIHVPDPIYKDDDNNDGSNEQRAYIRVGNETRYWENGHCIVYDTTYQHETYNPHPLQERVVLHIDFFNTIAMTSTEIEIMRYIYSLREQFMKAEGNAKVGAKIL
jgi:ornithine lipid ester-linked acyl 2-hydroxylase